VDTFVNKIKNTDLKGSLVKPIPTVAQATQGEVVKFASAATNTMSRDGYTVLLEGRAQTVRRQQMHPTIASPISIACITHRLTHHPSPSPVITHRLTHHPSPITCYHPSPHPLPHCSPR
jgi:hypothetical protein